MALAELLLLGLLPELVGSLAPRFSRLRLLELVLGRGGDGCRPLLPNGSDRLGLPLRGAPALLRRPSSIASASSVLLLGETTGSATLSSSEGDSSMLLSMSPTRDDRFTVVYAKELLCSVLSRSTAPRLSAMEAVALARRSRSSNCDEARFLWLEALSGRSKIVLVVPLCDGCKKPESSP